MLAIDLDIGDVVLEHGRDVDLITGKQAPRKRTRQRHVCTRRGRSWGRAEWETDLWEGSLGEDTENRISMAELFSCFDKQPYINKQVLPQAPSPTMTSFRRISAMFEDGKMVD